MGVEVRLPRQGVSPPPHNIRGGGQGEVDEDRSPRGLGSQAGIGSCACSCKPLPMVDSHVGCDTSGLEASITVAQLL